MGRIYTVIDDELTSDSKNPVTSRALKEYIDSHSGGGGGSIDVDTEMSDTSTNAVQNKVIKGYVDTLKEEEIDTLSQFILSPVYDKIFTYTQSGLNLNCFTRINHKVEIATSPFSFIPNFDRNAYYYYVVSASAVITFNQSPIDNAIGFFGNTELMAGFKDPNSIYDYPVEGAIRSILPYSNTSGVIDCSFVGCNKNINDFVWQFPIISVFPVDINTVKITGIEMKGKIKVYKTYRR